MFWFKKALGILTSVLAIVIIVGLILPSQVHVEREITIDSQPQKIYPLIANFKQWNRWSPWANIDPNTDFKIVGRGVKQKMFWSSEDARVGKGSQEFVALNKPHQIQTRLDFGQQGVANANFKLIGDRHQTRVIWSLDTNIREGIPLYRQPFAAYFGLFLDSMVGKSYEQGLNNLRDIVQP